MSPAARKNHMETPLKPKSRMIVSPAISLLETVAATSCQNHCGVIHNSRRVRSTRWFLIRWLKRTVEVGYHLVSQKKETSSFPLQPLRKWDNTLLC